MKTEKEYNQKKHNSGLNRRAFLLLFKEAIMFIQRLPAGFKVAAARIGRYFLRNAARRRESK